MSWAYHHRQDRSERSSRCGGSYKDMTRSLRWRGIDLLDDDGRVCECECECDSF